MFKIPAYNPYKQYNQGHDGAARAQQKSMQELDAAGCKLQAFFPMYAAKATAAEASLSSLLERISKRPYDPALELQEFANLPPWLQGSDVWKVSRTTPALVAGLLRITVLPVCNERMVPGMICMIAQRSHDPSALTF